MALGPLWAGKQDTNIKINEWVNVLWIRSLGGQMWGLDPILHHCVSASMTEWGLQVPSFYQGVWTLYSWHRSKGKRL